MTTDFDPTESTRPHRTRGRIESSEGVPPLPKIESTPEALERMLSWGIPPEFVTRLEELTSGFRYDLCPQRVKLLAERGGIIRRSKRGVFFTSIRAEEEIVLPNFNDLGTSQDGQCLDLAMQLLGSLHGTGYISELNAHLSGLERPIVRPCYVSGTSRTHFHNAGANHVHLGLIQEGGPIEDIITVDASFQEISNTDVNGYKLNRIVVDPRSIIQNRPNESVSLGTYQRERDGSFSFQYKNELVIGASQDRKYVYCIGFLRDTLSREIRPFISLVEPVHRKEVSLCLIDHKGEMCWDNDHDGIEESHREEVRQMLEHLASMTIVKDQRAGDAAAAEEKTITFY